MQIIDNINHIVKNDLQESIRTGSKLSIAAACFSIYAYQELKKQLESIDELRFIFTSPTFVTEKTPKAQREFYIPRISRERSLYGTEFEVKLRNELTQKAVAKECADWIRRKAIFKSNVTQEQMMGFMTVDESTYMPINGFTTVDLGCERGNNAYYPVQKTESYENANYFLKLFEQLWNDKNRLQEVTDVVIENISAAYRENAPEYIYSVALYNIFKCFQYENELRLIGGSFDDSPHRMGEGIVYLPIADISNFVERVMVHPLADDGYVSLIEKICQHFGIQFWGRSKIYEFKRK